MIVDGSFIEFPILTTKRLRLRPIEERDVEEIFNIFSCEEVMQYFGRYPMTHISEAEALVDKFNASYRESLAIRWAIELVAEGKLIGTCGYHNWKKPFNRSEIGYELSKDHWGKGLMKEALEAVIDYGFHGMMLNRIEAVVYPQNIPSAQLLKKLGFKHEGLMRQYAYFRDKYQDLDMFSLLREDTIRAVK